MAAATTDGTEQDSQSTPDLNATPGTGEVGGKALACSSEQEPGGDTEHGAAEMDENDGGGQGGGGEEEEEKPPPPGPEVNKEAGSLPENGGDRAEPVLPVPETSRPTGEEEEEEEDSPGELKAEQREESMSSSSSPPSCTKTKHESTTTDKPTTGHGTKRRASVEISSSDGEPLSRMDSEDSISSTLMDLDSAASSGRSTPAMMNGNGHTSQPGGGAKGYTCCWDLCQLLFTCSPDLAEHIRGTHVDGQRGGVFVCLWKGCKVYNTPSTSQSWLQRHMLTHSGDKPFKCVVGGCNATFASQGGLARHVPTHFSSQGSKLANQNRVKEESPSKAGLNKRRKMKNKRRRSLPRPHDFFDAQTMDAIRHRAICLNLATHIESLGNGHSVVFHSTVIARRKEDSGKVKVLLHWTPEDILPDAWVNETERSQQKTKVVHLSQLPTDTTVLLHPNIYRMFF